jgi:hypothetical protein
MFQCTHCACQFSNSITLKRHEKFYEGDGKPTCVDYFPLTKARRIILPGQSGPRASQAVAVADEGAADPVDWMEDGDGHEDDDPSHAHDEVEDFESEDMVQARVDQKVWSTYNSMNLSKRQIQTLLDLNDELLTTNCFPSFKTIEQFDQYTREQTSALAPLIVAPKYEGTVTVTKEDVPGMKDHVYTATYYYEDMQHFLTTEFANEDYQGYFVLHASEVSDSSGRR